MTEEDKLYTDKLKERALADYERLDHAINELERLTCETPRNNLAESLQDCISREEAISAIQDKYYDNAVGIDIVDIIAHLPSVTPQSKSGKWIEMYGEIPIYNAGGFTETKRIGWICSECKELELRIVRFCPNCGARMIESEG